MEYIAHIREKDNEIQTLEEHLTGVAERCRYNAEKLGFGDIGELLGLTHDIGKYHEPFQNYIKLPNALRDQDLDEEAMVKVEKKRSLKGKIDHSTAGAQLLWRELDDKAPSYIGLFLKQVLPLIIVSHHSGIIDCLSPDGYDVFLKRIEKSDDLTHLSQVKAIASEEILSRIVELIGAAKQSHEFLKAMILELLKDDLEPGKLIFNFKLGLLARMLFSCLIDADRTDAIDFEKQIFSNVRQKGVYAGWDFLTNRLENHIAEFKGDDGINLGRRYVSDCCRQAAEGEKGFFTLTVPTGGGKTLASLRFALHHAKRYATSPKHAFDRIFYIIPYTSIIDQNVAVARKILELNEDEKGRIVLECHSNLSSDRNSWRAKILSENWDAPIVFTTMVQFLETLFDGGTRSVRKMHQLARSILIFDEIQTLPIRVVHMFCNALNFLVGQCGSSAVLCTATQPLLNEVRKTRGSLAYTKENEIVPDVSKLFEEFKRVDFVDKRKPGGFSFLEIADLAIKEQCDLGTVLIILNTTGAAKEVYACIKENFEQTVHISAKMCSAHRNEVLGYVRESLEQNPQKPLICVSTQVIEAGVDVDFGSVIRSIAGIDSLMQAAGRANRHGLRASGRLLIINPKDENIESLADIKEGRSVSERILSALDTNGESEKTFQVTPEMISGYFGEYFFKRAKEMSYLVANSRNDSLLGMLSRNSMARREFEAGNPGKTYVLPMAQSFASASAQFRALDAPTRAVIVPYGRGKEIIAELCSDLYPALYAGLLKEAQRYSVNVYPGELCNLEREGGVYEITLSSDDEKTGLWALRSEFYSSELGLSPRRISRMEGAIA